VDSHLDAIVQLFPEFKRSASPPLDSGIAECLAIYWTIATANDTIDDASAGRIAEKLIPLTLAQSWSEWNGNHMGFQERFASMCQGMMAGKQAAFAMGAGQASAEVQQNLFVMNVAKAGLASSGLDDTNEQAVLGVMNCLGQFHEKVWPHIRAAGTPKPPH
jgi:hypothetical protein